MKKRRILALIAARGGSKGLKDKNIRLLGGRPLISYSVLPCVESEHIDRVVVSTDSPEIAEIARQFGAEVPFMRPAEEATDTADLGAVYNTCLNRLYQEERYEPEIVLYLFPTYPFKTRKDVDTMIEDIAHRGYETSMLGNAVPREDLTDVCIIDADGRALPLPIRVADIDHGWFSTNNSIFAGATAPRALTAGITDPDERDHVKALYFKDLAERGITNGKAMVRPADRIRGIDIDTIDDFNLAELVIRRRLFDFEGVFHA